jgi:hypothetical protein
MANDGKYRVANPDHFDSDTNFYSNLDLDLDPGPTSHLNSDPDPYCFMYRVFPFMNPTGRGQRAIIQFQMLKYRT